ARWIANSRGRSSVPLAPHRQHLAGLLPLDQRYDMSAPYLCRVAFSGFVLRPIADAGEPPAPFPKDLPGKKSGAQVGLFRLERLARCAASCTKWKREDTDDFYNAMIETAAICAAAAESVLRQRNANGRTFYEHPSGTGTQ